MRSLFERLYPDEYHDSVYNIDFQEIYNQGYKGILFDIDNTLVPHGAKADKRAIALFDKLKLIGFKCCLISNNDEDRVKMFNDDVNVNYIFKAGKPLAKNYIKAAKMLHTGINDTIFIGDQIFTDIYGANRAGIYSVLVQPMNPKEEIQIVLKRYLEKIVLFFYLRRKK